MLRPGVTLGLLGLAGTLAATDMTTRVATSTASPMVTTTPAAWPIAIYLPYARQHDRLASTIDWQCWDGSSPNPCHYELRAVAMVTEDDGWAVGERGTILSWDGVAWRAALSPTRQSLHAIAMASSTQGWAVGDQGTILQWDGTAWLTIPSPIDYDLHAVAVASPTAVWVVGSWGTVLYWDGVSWTDAGSDLWTYSEVESYLWYQWYDIEVLSETDA